MKKILFLFISVILFASCNNGNQSAFVGEEVKPATEVGTIPEESIFNLTDTFITQNNQPIVLSDFTGKPTVMSMIFTNCSYACPRLAADVKIIEDNMGKDADKVNFVLVSFDPERDTPEQLESFRKSMKLGEHFTLLHGDEDAVRTLSVLMNVQYQKNSNGDFSHSNIISLLDKNGNLISQKEGINVSQDGTIEKLKSLIN